MQKWLPQPCGEITAVVDCSDTTTLQEPDTPPIELSGGERFQPRCAWTDIYEAICNARHLIYIAGWSIYDKITLVRDPSKPMFPSEVPTLGQSPLVCYSKFFTTRAALL